MKYELELLKSKAQNKSRGKGNSNGAGSKNVPPSSRHKLQNQTYHFFQYNYLDS